MKQQAGSRFGLVCGPRFNCVDHREALRRQWWLFNRDCHSCCGDETAFEQLEAVLAHELAHIRRHDFLVNLLGMPQDAIVLSSSRLVVGSSDS
jgi:hypothetical protein